MGRPAAAAAAPSAVATCAAACDGRRPLPTAAAHGCDGQLAHAGEGPLQLLDVRLQRARQLLILRHGLAAARDVLRVAVAELIRRVGHEAAAAGQQRGED